MGIQAVMAVLTSILILGTLGVTHYVFAQDATISFDATSYSPTGTAFIQLELIDSTETDPDLVDEKTIKVISGTDTDGLMIIAQETGTNTDIFQAQLTFSLTGPSAGQTLHVAAEDGVTASFEFSPDETVVGAVLISGTADADDDGLTNDEENDVYATDPKNPDTDDDSLLDGWEVNGLDVNDDGIIDLNLADMGASPLYKDIFIEVDYMEFHILLPQAKIDVENNFANAPVSNPDGNNGINLHVDVDEQIAHQDELEIWSGFDTIKMDNFGSAVQRADPNSENILDAKKLVYHYAALVHQRSDNTSSGKGELPGNDFFLSLGNSAWGADAGGHFVGTLEEQRGTFQHELGHNLGLYHGGIDDGINCKPNYLSVMNYAYQMEFNPSDRIQDYSSEKFDLDEAHLDENIGVPSLTGLNVEYGPSPKFFMPTNAPINWDREGDSTDADTSADINNVGTTSCGGSGTDLIGQNDWDALVYDFRSTSDFVDGVHTETTANEEIPAEELSFITSTKLKGEICHEGKKTITVSENAIPAHLAHGDERGTCEK